MNVLISLLIWGMVFAIVAYGLVWVCDHFALPQPVKWICGAILLVILLVFVAGQLGDGQFPLRLR